MVIRWHMMIRYPVAVDVGCVANITVWGVLWSCGLVGTAAKAQIQENVPPVMSIQFMGLCTGGIGGCRELVVHRRPVPGLDVFGEVILRWVWQGRHMRRSREFKGRLLSLHHCLRICLNGRVLYMIRVIVGFCTQ